MQSITSRTAASAQALCHQLGTIILLAAPRGCQLSRTTKPPALLELVPRILPNTAHSASWVWDRMLSDGKMRKVALAPGFEVERMLQRCVQLHFHISPCSPNRSGGQSVTLLWSTNTWLARTTPALLLDYSGLECKPPRRARITIATSHFRLGHSYTTKV